MEKGDGDEDEEGDMDPLEGGREVGEGIGM